MVCRFVIGRAGTGKTHYCLEEMARRMQQEQLDAPLLFLLPEQATFIHERMLATQYLPHGYAGGEVISFRRLIWRAAQRQALPPLPQLSEAGRSLLMGKLLSARREGLRVFGAAGLGSGFAQELVSLAEELMVYDVGPEQLATLAAKRQAELPRDPLAAKLSDIALLYGDYQAEISGQYDNFADGMAYLAQQILEEGFLSGATILIDGYSQFTPRELAVLEALMQRAARLEIALALDPADLTRTLQAEDLFYPTWQSYQRLQNAARKHHIEVEAPLCLDGARGRFAANPELAFLERHCYPLHRRASWPQAPQTLQLTAAADRRQELAAVGRQILRLVREEGLRFRQISVIARESDAYADLLPTVFGELGIPYFVDAQKPLLYHPLVELTRAALEIWAGDAHYRAIFRYLKAGFSGLTAEELDRLENYCLAHGIRHWQWRMAEDWHWWRGPGSAEEKALKLADINALRRRATAALFRFLAQAPAAKGDVALPALLDALQKLLQELEAARILQQWQEEALAAGDGATAALHRQAYEKVAEFLREARLLLADCQLEARQILSMFDAGCAALTLSLIPPGLDQVLVASLERSRNPELAACFVIGVNADLLPKKIVPDALFSDYDRNELAQQGIELAPNTLHRQLAEHYLAYVGLTRSGERLSLSYALNSEDGKGLPPSPLIRRVRGLFPQLKLQQQQEEQTPGELTGGMNSLATLARKLAAARAGEQLAGFWRDVYNWYAAEADWTDALARLAQGLDFQPLRGHLQSATRQQLYGRQLQSSVSRLEKYRACPFAYFAAYGLKLKERPQYQITPLERGEIFHQALAELGKRLGSERELWQQLDEQQAESLVDEVLEPLLPSYLAGILESTARYRYLAARIRQTLISTLLLMAEQMRRGAFVPVAWELPFGGRPDDLLPPLTIDLGEGKRLELNGQIDRVDLATGEEHSYFRIIDYKTGDVSLSVPDIFQGLRLQLMVYLQVVLDNRLYFKTEQAAAAGLYYMAVRDQLLAGEMPPEDAEPEPAGLRLNGLTVLDQEAVRLADPQISGHSKLIPVALGAQGFYSNSPGLSAPRLELLRDHLLATLRETAQQLVSGLVEVAPRRDRNFDACGYCDYRSFCGFDGALAEPRAARALNADAVWRILEGGDQADGL